MHANTPKLPVRQLLILAICRFAEPIAVTSYLPYLPEMIESVGVPKAEVAQWAGLTTAVFSFAQAAMAVYWGTTSDRFGRKPIILLGLICTMVLSLAFGLSKSLPVLVGCRAMIGLMNGNVGIIRTMVAEMVQDKALQPRAFSVMPMVWTVGSVIGPAFGGSLARPAEKYPEIFGRSKFFREYPFVLPNIAAGIFFLVGITTGYLFLHETLAAKKGHRDSGLVLGQLLTRPCTRRCKTSIGRATDNERTPLLGGEQEIAKSPQDISRTITSRWRDILNPQSALILTAYASMSVHTMAYESLLPVFLHSPPQHFQDNLDVQLPFKFVGGFGMDSQEIGMYYTLTGIVGMVVQFYVFPACATRFGVLKCVKATSIAYPVLYLLTPYVALVPESMRSVTIFFLILIKLTAAIFNFPSLTILLTNSASSLSILGTLNGVATSVSAIGRAAGPAMLGPIFSLGVRAGYIIIPWWSLTCIAVISAIPVPWIVEGDGFQAQSTDELEPEPEESAAESHPAKHPGNQRRG
ncbi:MFS transporter [Aspergillus lucknowensis]|uniref:Major facilitator superfamily domain-containing protein n=1 Tax=Aspergillus lucknowensis TaxID=176173 RepID=A0ABR4M382_9EURO